MNNILFVICMAITLVGTMETTYQICKLIVLDASARGLKHPRLWGLLAINGNNSSGLLFYLLRRRKYPLKNIDEHQRTLINKRKKSAGINGTHKEDNNLTVVIPTLWVSFFVLLFEISLCQNQ